MWGMSFPHLRRRLERGIELKLKLSDRIMLLLAGAVTALAALCSIILPGSPITFVLMIPFFFFLPGYALSRLIFRQGLELDEFILSSIALSIVASMLMAAGLAISPIELTQGSMLVSFVALTFIALLADYLTRKEERRFEVELILPKREDVDPIIAVAIAFGLVLAGVFAYIIVTTQPPSDTHIYLLSEYGDDNMPTNATVGSLVNFTVVMKNGEGRSAEFQVQIFNNTYLYNDTESDENSYTAIMDDNETVKRSFSLVFSEPGEQKIEARIFIDGASYGEVHFWVNVQ
jgi:uncharacterized membrane protein